MGERIAMGYYKDEQATKETFIDGWLRTGDEVMFHENGDMFVLDRIKEFIKVKSFQVAPAELEGYLLAHPDVLDVGVIGIADEYAGEVPLAFVVPQPELAASIKNDASVAAAVRARICKVRRPEPAVSCPQPLGRLQYVKQGKSKPKWLVGGVAFVDAIPKTPRGKILRRVLRKNVNNVTVRARL